MQGVPTPEAAQRLLHARGRVLPRGGQGEPRRLVSTSPEASLRGARGPLTPPDQDGLTDPGRMVTGPAERWPHCSVDGTRRRLGSVVVLQRVDGNQGVDHGPETNRVPQTASPGAVQATQVEDRRTRVTSRVTGRTGPILDRPAAVNDGGVIRSSSLPFFFKPRLRLPRVRRERCRDLVGAGVPPVRSPAHPDQRRSGAPGPPDRGRA